MESKENLTENETRQDEQVETRQENQLEETELEEISGGGYGIGGKSQNEDGYAPGGAPLSVNKQGYAIGG